MRCSAALAVLALSVAAVLFGASQAHAKFTESQCLQQRYKAASSYSRCEQTTLGKFFGTSTSDDGPFQRAISKCRTKYTATWARLQAAASGSGTTCANNRFADNGDGTVTDRLTALQWEQKTDDGSVRDKDNSYTWTDTGDADSTNADGTAYTSFLATLNGGGCFAGQCDWRLPTIAELQTIVSEPFVCAASPCIDEPLFGPTAPSFYWSSTTYANAPDGAWSVTFLNGGVVDNRFLDYVKYNSFSVRAVRGGL